jgi:hypothetical protein
MELYNFTSMLIIDQVILARLLSNTHDAHIDLLRRRFFEELDNSTGRASNAWVQAAIYGYLGNFYGAEGAFSYGHEFGHYHAG